MDDVIASVRCEAISPFGAINPPIGLHRLRGDCFVGISTLSSLNTLVGTT